MPGISISMEELPAAVAQALTLCAQLQAQHAPFPDPRSGILVDALRECAQGLQGVQLTAATLRAVADEAYERGCEDTRRRMAETSARLAAEAEARAAAERPAPLLRVVGGTA